MTENTSWRVHWLEAEGDLGAFKRRVGAGIEAAHGALRDHISLRPLDILIQAQPGGVIPEIGMLGHAHHRSLFSLFIDPTNPHLDRCLLDGTLTRQIVHEIHHCYRMDGPGYGRTLGEALVSEGLAGQFVRHIFQNQPEPWECAFDAEELLGYLPDDEALWRNEYDHSSWFFGSTETCPRWLGYTLGYRLVGSWLKNTAPITSSTWIDAPARSVLSVGLEQIREKASCC